jgi:hypothetical protein
VIDLINHDGSSPNASLKIREEGVAVVVAAPQIGAGHEALFDYHPDHATVRSMLRGYGFVDQHQRRP